MRVLLAVVLTAIITAGLTWTFALAYRDEVFAALLWERCPQTIKNPHGPEAAWIETLDGTFIPVRPRPTK
jgi:hypothetical protein